MLPRSTTTNPQGRRWRRRGPSRQGVVLLVILSLLSIFIVISTTFLLVTSHYNRAAQSLAQEKLLRDPPNKLLDMAFYQLVRGTNDPRSAARAHDLLGDLYGHNGIRGRVTQSFNVGGQGGQLVEIEVDTGSLENFDGTPGSILGYNDWYAGCVLTFTSGTWKGTSTRVVRYEIPTTPPNIARFQILRPTSPDDPNFPVVTPAPGDSFILNDHAFNGTGFAFNPNAPANQPQLHPEALFINWMGIEDISQYLEGGADESYDAPDFQNVALAAIIPDPNNLDDIAHIIPSFHRPALLQYLQAYDANNAHRGLLRPDPNASPPTASPNFPALADPLLGPWDVDNDGDGIPDSIWVDFGFPAQTARNGRQYRPLVAVLCLDMDGRFNLNFHGSRAHAALPTATPVYEESLPAVLARGHITNSATNPSPKGNGFGVADINLAYLFSNAATDPRFDQVARAAYNLLLQGVSNESLAGRYGYGALAVPGPFASNVVATKKYRGVPFNYFSPTVLSSYATPLDLHGELAFGLDTRGLPVYELPAFVMSPDIRTGNPYDLDIAALRGNTSPATPSRENLFSAFELERILRSTDWDAHQLTSRLSRLFNGNRQVVVGGNGVDVTFSFDLPRNRRAVTTESWHIPTPGLGSTRDVLDIQDDPNYRTKWSPSRNVRHILELLSIRYKDLMKNNPGATEADVLALVNSTARELLPDDLLRHLPMDLNRPFGNGLDDDGDGVVDEPSEVLDAGGAEPIHGLLARQQYAKHLYVMAMLLVDRGALSRLQFDLDPNAPTNDRNTARGIAQWAVNVVDFRDADSIMTPFEYDPYPLDGSWDVDDDFTTHLPSETPDREVVWGTERPELIITETFAVHDRKTEDLDDPSGGTIANGDDDMDQRYIPAGAFFVELYNPWAGLHDKKPAELYGPNPDARPDAGVILNQLAPGGAPVWRLVVVGGDSKGEDPDAPPGTGSNFSLTDIDRIVYFASVPNPPTVPGAYVHQPRGVAANIAPLLPGRYAVVGTGRDNQAPFRTTFGFRRDFQNGTNTYLDATRQIVLDPSPNLNVNQVTVLNNERQDVPGTPARFVPPPPGPMAPMLPFYPEPLPIAQTRQNAVAVAINDPPLTLTEPYDNYQSMIPPPPQYVAGTGQAEPYLEPPMDEPFDLRVPERFDGDRDAIQRTGTTPRFRTVYLQRLADPQRPYDADTNPYRTIDWMDVNLTSFNGVLEDQQQDQDAVKVGVSDDIPFATLERGEDGNPLAWPPAPQDDTGRMLWRRPNVNQVGLESPRERNQDAASFAHNFDYYLHHSLGYLNKKYWPYHTAADAPSPSADPITAGSSAHRYIGSPSSFSGPPFPWLTWNNRPFANAHELLNVPFPRSSQLFDFYTIYLNNGAYDPSHPANAANLAAGRSYGHLLHFHGTSSPMSGPAAHFYRLLDYVHVPSRFAGTEVFFNSNFITADPDGQLGVDARLSMYREPGRVNINTVFDPRVWRALLNGHNGPTFAEVHDSRRGYAPGGSSLPDSSPDYPTFMANPFRPSTTAAYVPPLLSSGSLERVDVETTLMRSEAIGPAPPQQTDEPLMSKNASTLVHNDARRNAYFQYQTLQRMGNLVTTRSNVYAIWITIGYFEVDPDTGLLGQELGSDTGEVERHRAFYLIDRSIPVGYEPGENHNVEKTLLLRRYIE